MVSTGRDSSMQLLHQNVNRAQLVIVLVKAVCFPLLTFPDLSVSFFFFYRVKTIIRLTILSVWGSGGVL